MKKLFLIRYTWHNKTVEHEASHFEDVYYLCKSLAEAYGEIQDKFNDDTEVKITQFEEIYYKEI